MKKRCSTFLLAGALLGCHAEGPASPPPGSTSGGGTGVVSSTGSAPTTGDDPASDPSGRSNGGTTSPGGTSTGPTTSTGDASNGGGPVDGGPAADGASGSGGGPSTGTGGGEAGAPGTDAALDGGKDPEPVRCPSTPLGAGDHDGSVQAEGRERSYVMHVPGGYTGDEPVPVVFDFHGYGSSGRGQMGASGFREVADAHGFVVVYPDGVGGSWHVNGCCGQAAQESIDEIAVVRAMVADVREQVCVDPGRIYATGISQGGGMAHHVGCLAADLFAAVAPVSSDLRTEPCEPEQPVAQMSFRGTADSLSAYEGGPVGPPGGQYQSIGAKQTLERWRMISDCTGTAEPSLELCETYTQCAGGVEVTLCTLPGGGHVLYDNPSDFDVAAAAWTMFERQAR